MVSITDINASMTSQQRYLPFGGVREDIGSIHQTDYGYTGQRNLNSTGLMDYKFRMYSPLLGRFISPDTLISNPANPQTFNRYSYVGNRPINFNDPTGHVACDEVEGICKPNATYKPLRWVLFASGEGADEWEEEEMDVTQQGAEDIGNAIVRQIEYMNQKLVATGEDLLDVPTAREAYFALFEGFITFKKLATNNCNCWGQYHSNSEVYIYSHADITSPNAGTLFIVHELAHVYDNINSHGPRDALSVVQANQAGFPDRGGGTSANYGFADSFRSGWQQSRSSAASEEFADQFIGWTYNNWAANPSGQARANFMNNYMLMWIAPSFTP